MAKVQKVDLAQLGLFLTTEVNSQSEEEYRAFCYDVYGEVLKKTPVDTGRARANWNIQSDSPDYSIGTPPDTSSFDVKGFSPVYISNGLNYIRFLEEGRSSQAPNGITKPALAAVRSRR